MFFNKDGEVSENIVQGLFTTEIIRVEEVQKSRLKPRTESLNYAEKNTVTSDGKAQPDGENTNKSRALFELYGSVKPKLHQSALSGPLTRAASACFSPAGLVNKAGHFFQGDPSANLWISIYVCAVSSVMDVCVAAN